MLPIARYMRDCLVYDPAAGEVRWRDNRPKCHFKNETSRKVWLGKTASKPFGRVNGTGRIYGKVSGKSYQAHRIAFLLMEGRWPVDEVDHINGDPLDNRWCNIREVNRVANMRNMKRRSDNTSGTVGVYWFKRTGRWAAKIGDKGLGTFETKAEAIAARKAAEQALGYHENHGR